MKIKYLFLLLGTLYSGSEVLAKCNFSVSGISQKCSRCGSGETHGKCIYRCSSCRGLQNKSVSWDPGKTVQVIIEDGKMIAKEV